MPSPITTTAPGPASPAEPLRPPVTAAASAERVKRRGVLLYAEHQLRNMRRYGAVLLVGALGEPVLYLLAMGLGLAQLMGGGMPQDALGGVSYVAFIAPALLASGALMTASVEFSYPVMGGFQWQRTYYAAQATPLSPAQIALGHLAAVSLRFVFQAAVFLLVMLAFGVVSSPWAWVQVLTATLGGLAVGAPIMAFAASLKEDKGQFATLQRLVVMPLFLFSATFYPLEALPVWLRWIGWLSPQWHAAQLGRVLSYGMAEPVWLTVAHVAFLLALALGARTIKMNHGHHGANHPVKDLVTGKVEITSMNHGFTVDSQTLPAGVVEDILDFVEGAPGVTVWTARAAGRVAAIAALRVMDDNTGEVKSMRTHPDFLRQGAGAALLGQVIGEARRLGLSRLSLETGSGPAFDPALALYRRRGFVAGPAFGPYEKSAFNQFLHMELDASHPSEG